MEGLSSIFGSVTKKTTADKFDFRKTHTLKERQNESARVKIRYPERIPIVCEIDNRTSSKIKLDRPKYLVPHDITVAQFLHVIRQRIRLTPEKALFLFIEGINLPPTSQLMGVIYNDHKNEDGFLYFTVALESTFG